MGKFDTLTKNLLQDDRHFADVFNATLFGGKKVVDPDELVERDTTEFFLDKKSDGDLVESQKARDVFKRCQYILKTSNHAAFLLLGIENQTDIHYAMPIKVMNYDALAYDKQLRTISGKHRKAGDLIGAEYTSRFAKKDRIIPVITLVIYFGADKWDGPRSLHEMMGEQDPEVLQYVQDYKLNLVIPNEIEDFDKFETEFGCLMKAIKCSKNRKELDELMHTEPYELMDSPMVANAIAEFVGLKLNDSHTEGGRTNMCKAWEDQKQFCIAEGREEGRKEGRKEGREEGVAQRLAQMLNNGIDELTLLNVGFTREEIEKARKVSC